MERGTFLMPKSEALAVSMKGRWISNDKASSRI